MQILSKAFENNTMMPSKYTCDGQNINPPLKIKDIPTGSISLVLIVDDPDAPGRTFLHWLAYDISPYISDLEENANSSNFKQGINDFGRENYGGPCPPSGTHRYFFRVFALDKRIKLPNGSLLEEVEKEMEGHILDKAELVGLYRRR